jgi:hypothetical protein
VSKIFTSEHPDTPIPKRHCSARQFSPASSAASDKPPELTCFGIITQVLAQFILSQHLCPILK